MHGRMITTLSQGASRFSVVAVSIRGSRFTEVSEAIVTMIRKSCVASFMIKTSSTSAGVMLIIASLAAECAVVDTIDGLDGLIVVWGIEGCGSCHDGLAPGIIHSLAFRTIHSTAFFEKLLDFKRSLLSLCQDILQLPKLCCKVFSENMCYDLVHNLGGEQV